LEYVIPGRNPESGNDNVVRSSTRDDLTRFEDRLKKAFPGCRPLISWAVDTKKTVVRGPKAIRAAGISSRDLVILSWVEDRLLSREAAAHLYKVAIAVGPVDTYPSLKSFLAACSIRAGRPLTTDEADFFVRKGKASSLSQF
jgi:hypothetical protein